MTSNSQLALTNSWELVAVLDLGLGFNVRIRIRMTSSTTTSIFTHNKQTNNNKHQTTNTCEVVTLQGPVVQMPVSLTLG
jgi:uncharacterized protein HemX